MKLQAGFTLMELLIVIAIIGILVSASAAAYGTAQTKSRDTRRINDMKSIQNAFEQYYAQNNSVYPDVGCSLGVSSTQYLPAGVPKDPIPTPAPPTTPTYVYTGTCTTTTYTYCAKLENPSGNASDAFGANYGTKGTFYCVKNLQ